MTPKEKAKELYDKFSPHVLYWDGDSYNRTEIDHAKKCSLLCVDELIECTHADDWSRKRIKFDKQYWQQVKQELEKL